MGEHSWKVERQRVLLEAEEWAKGVNAIHAHSLNSMWYDTRPQDTEGDKTVCDRHFNNGLIERTCHDGSIVYFGRELKGDELIDQYQKVTGSSVING